MLRYCRKNRARRHATHDGAYVQEKRPEANKITISHSSIADSGMRAMTMVFCSADPRLY
ncbi:MAG: copper-binding protein [Burkholderiales bacterium]|nr:copper-binding protein [Burkholderiales bacterium]